MSERTQSTWGVKTRRLLLGAAILFVICAWTAVVIGYFMQPSLPVWAALVTVGAVSLEVLLWTAAGVFGWSFLAKRRERMQRWFGRKPQAESNSDS